MGSASTHFDAFCLYQSTWLGSDDDVSVLGVTSASALAVCTNGDETAKELIRARNRRRVVAKFKNILRASCISPAANMYTCAYLGNFYSLQEFVDAVDGMIAGALRDLSQTAAKEF